LNGNCYSLINNCEIDDGNISDLKCQKCLSTYKISPDQKSCAVGDISNCDQYDLSGICVSCLEFYKLNSNQCVYDENEFIHQNCKEIEPS